MKVSGSCIMEFILRMQPQLSSWRLGVVADGSRKVHSWILRSISRGGCKVMWLVLKMGVIRRAIDAMLELSRDSKYDSIEHSEKNGGIYSKRLRKRRLIIHNSLQILGTDGRVTNVKHNFSHSYRNSISMSTRETGYKFSIVSTFPINLELWIKLLRIVESIRVQVGRRRIYHIY